MIYTSGTTGQPKGVRREAPTAAQAAAAETMRARVYGLKPGVRALLPGPLYHSAPNVFALRAGRLGGALFLMPRFDAEALLHLVQEEAIDTIFMVPTMFVRLLKLPTAVREKYDVSSLRHIVHAAAPCPPDVKRAIMDWWGPVIHEYYGSTESGAVTYAAPEDALRKPGTVGRILEGALLRILDDAGTFCRTGPSARSIRAPPAAPISAITTSQRSGSRSNVTVSSPAATSAISMKTAMSSFPTASATW